MLRLEHVTLRRLDVLHEPIAWAVLSVPCLHPPIAFDVALRALRGRHLGHLDMLEHVAVELNDGRHVRRLDEADLLPRAWLHTVLVARVLT